MVEIQLRPGHAMATILTGIQIPRVDVDTAEAHVPPRHPVKRPQENDLRYPDEPPHDAGRVVPDAHPEPPPRFEVVRLVMLVYGFRDAAIEQAIRSANRGYVDR